MFYVKEYRQNGLLINFTPFYDENLAISLAKQVLNVYPEFIVKVTEMDFDSRGNPWEMNVWENV